LPRRPSQQGFHKTFGQGRSIKRDLIQGDSQRPSGDTASNLKRTRNIDRRDERSPVGQRDRLEGSSPTALGANRQRPPDNARPHPSSQSSKSSTSHVSSVPLKPVLDLIAERMTWFRARNEASKSHKRAMANQEQSHYRPSDYASSPELLATQQRQTLEEMRKAEKNLGEFDDRIAAAMQQLLQHMSEAWSKSPDASNASEDREASEAKMNTIQNTIQKEMEESFKKEATESQQLMKDLIGSQMAKLKEALTQENEQKLHSLQKTLAQEAEDRATSLRKTLMQDNEKRVAEMKDSINREHKARIIALENALSEEAKNKARIAALENAFKSQLTSLDDKIAMIDAELRMTISDQRILSESWINKAQLAEQLQQLSLSQDKKLGKLEAQVNLLPDHSPRIEELAEQICDHSKLIKDKEQMQDEANLRLDSLESTLTNFLEEGEEIKERVQKLSSTKPVSVSNDQILEVIKPEMAKNTKDTREMIMQIQHKLRPFLEQERHKRETLEEQVGDVARQITEIQKESATTKTDYSGLTEKLDGQTDEVKRLEESTNIRIGLIMDEFRSQMESVYIQVQTLNSWQTNFSTQGLYRDMVNHINRTIPEGPAAVPQIKLLKQQVSGIETRIAAWESTSNKKRKLVSGNARVVNGHQTD
ncbi:uncharacterized protein TRIVIDRAFT_11899, partial [Trichoderma virens Gv29-8]